MSKMCNVPILQEYERLTRKEGCNPDVWTNLACCYFFLGMYQESSNAAQNGEIGYVNKFNDA